jgi:hypothetical protein
MLKSQKNKRLIVKGFGFEGLDLTPNPNYKTYPKKLAFNSIAVY